jgi:hypothetical protein
LNWEVDSYPAWGTWTFAPDSGTLPDGDWETVDVTVVAPDDPNTEFTGTVKIVNVDNSTDYCEISVYLKTPVNQNLMILQLLRSLMMQRLSQ